MNKFSKIGFILSIIGGSVGLGNAWKFPTIVAQNGGSAFILVFLLIIFTLGFGVFIAEFAIGKITQKDLSTAYKMLAKNNGNFYKFGGIFMLGGVLVLSFYLVILGWVFRYMFLSFQTLPNDINTAGIMFENAISNDFFISFLCFLICAFLCFYFLARGIKAGIEKLNIYAIPILAFIVIFMLIYAFFLDGFNKAFEFIFYIDFSQFHLSSLLDALGLGLFIVCLGVGCISAYAANCSDEFDLKKDGFFIILLNVFIGLAMGLIIFTLIYNLGSSPNMDGGGLVFVGLMGLFSKLGLLGNFLAFLLFFSLFIAGITSAVSMVEPFIFYLQNRFDFTRFIACACVFIVVVILGGLSLYSIQKDIVFGFFNKTFFDNLDFISSNIMLPSGALFTCIFIGFGANFKTIEIYLKPILGQRLFIVWFYFIKFVCPLIIIIILFNNFYPITELF